MSKASKAIENFYWSMAAALQANGNRINDDIDDPYWRGVLNRAMPAFWEARAAIREEANQAANDYPYDVEPPSQDELDNMTAMDLWHYKEGVGM